MGLVLDWQKKLGYRHDPFDQAIPTPVKAHLVGLERIQERFNLFLIKEERFGTIAGEKGTGKTMLLRWMDAELAPQKSHAQHYLDAKTFHGRETIAQKLLNDRLSLLEKGIGRFTKKKEDPETQLLQHLSKERKNVILVDNAGSLSDGAMILLTEILKKTPTHLIFSDTSERLKRLGTPEGMTDTLRLALPSYTHDDCAEILRRRITGAGGAGTFPFSEKDLADLARKADSNPAKLLHLAREHAIELSLTVKEAPRPAPSAQPERKGGFLSIKVERKPQGTPEPAFERQAPATAVEAAREEREKADTSEDADLLAQVVSTMPTQPERASAPVTKSKADDVIAKIAEEFEEIPEKPKRAPAKAVHKKKDAKAKKRK